MQPYPEKLAEIRASGHATDETSYYPAVEALLAEIGHPDYDTSYVSHRQVAKDCTFSYGGNRYSVPYSYVGKSVLVRQGLDSGAIRIFHQNQIVAEHRLGSRMLRCHPNFVLVYGRISGEPARDNDAFVRVFSGRFRYSDLKEAAVAADAMSKTWPN